MSKYERENKASEKGMAHKHWQPNSVSEIEGTHGGEKGHQGGVVFRMPKDSEISDHSCVRSPEHKSSRANTSSGKPQAPAGKAKNEAAKLSRDSRGLQFRIGETRAQKAKPEKIKV